MNLLIHDFAAAIEREACADLDHWDRFEANGAGIEETRQSVSKHGIRVEPPVAGARSSDAG